MNPKTAIKDPLEGRLYPIGTVSSLTGVPPITLRAWERRHGLVQPHRKRSGHRLFTREDIDLILRVVVLIEDGMRIGQVREQLLAEDRRRDEAHGSTVWATYRKEMIAAIAHFDEHRLESTYGNALSLHPVETVTHELLAPLLVELGDRWQSGSGSVAEEHFFAFYLRNTLGARFHHRHRENPGRRILAACLPGEHHEIGLLLFGLSAHQAGLQLIFLGPNTPLGELAGAAAISHCEAIVLSGAIEPEPSVIGNQLVDLRNETDLPIFIGGAVSIDCCDAIERAGATVLGSNITQGLKRLIDALESKSQESETPT
jgi:DNA-binding transcriptional MerR regulator